MAEGAQSIAQKITARSRDPVEEVFRKANINEGLRAGLHYFINRAFKKDVGEDSDGFVAWAVEISTGVLGDNF